MKLKLDWLRQHVILHSLHHCYGAHLVEIGLNLRAIQHELGHEYPKTTVLYTQRIDVTHQDTKKMINHLISRLQRGRLLSLIKGIGLHPPATPKQWVVQCKRVGNGLPAPKYLSCYLYRGVISDKNILNDDGPHVTFPYTDTATISLKTLRERDEDFMALVLQHVLSKGFLHGNAKRLLKNHSVATASGGTKRGAVTKALLEVQALHQPMRCLGFI